MKITMYELLGLVKDGKAPKKIMFLGNTYRYDEIDKTYRNIIGNTNIGEMHSLEFYLDDEVEIIEEEKKIPENNFNYIYSCEDEHIMANFENIKTTLKDIIDYLKNKGDE